MLRLVNLKLAYHKGQYGRSVDWIGTFLKFGSSGILATIKQEKRSELQKLIASTLRKNVVSSKVLQSLARKLSDVARFLITWSPFLCDLLAALAGGTPPGAPHGCIWTKQIRQTLLWFQAFLNFYPHAIRMPFPFDAYSKSASRIVVTTDASPFGFGGVLQINGEDLLWVGGLASASRGTDRASVTKAVHRTLKRSWHRGPAERKPSPLTNMTNMQVLHTLPVARCLLHGRDSCAHGWDQLSPSYPLHQSTSHLWALL